MTSGNVYHPACVYTLKEMNTACSIFLGSKIKTTISLSRMRFKDACFFFQSNCKLLGMALVGREGTCLGKDLLIRNDNDAYVAKALA